MSSRAIGWRVCNSRRKWNAPWSAPASLREAMTVTWRPSANAERMTNPSSPARSKRSDQPNPAIRGDAAGVPTRTAPSCSIRVETRTGAPSIPSRPRRSSSAMARPVGDASGTATEDADLRYESRSPASRMGT